MPKLILEKNHKKIIKKLIIVAFILICIITASLLYIYSQKESLPVDKEVVELTQIVGNLIELPGDEIPTIATILDEEKVKDENFFKNAKTGDKLLAYIKNRKAILYRPSSNKIIEVAPISFNENK